MNHPVLDEVFAFDPMDYSTVLCRMYDQIVGTRRKFQW